MLSKPSTFAGLLLISLLLISCSPTLATAQESMLRAGAATVDISPKTLPALQNGGFLQRVTQRVLDPLHARALVLADGKETIAIVIVDTCMFPTSLCDEIKRLATKTTGIPSNRILISATHTHTAPAAMLCLGCDADEPYVKYAPGRVAQAIVDAHERLRPAKLGWAIVDGSELTNCRRWITRSDQMKTDPFGDRTVRAMMHPGYQNPTYTSPAGPVDPWLSVLSVIAAEDDSPICLFANLSMHYFGGGGFSADYFGEVARLLEGQLKEQANGEAGKFVGVMSQGTSGDLHWMDYSRPRQSISRQQYSERVAARILHAYKTIKHQSHHALAMAERRLQIGRRLPSQGRREWARPINAARGERPPKSQVEVYAQQAEWLHENPTAEVVLQAVRIGDLGVTAIPNEVYGITGLKLKRQSPLAATFNLELANGAAGYIPPPEQHRLGGYTTWPARTAGLDEQAEPKIVETLLQLLETVAEKKRRAITPAITTYAKAVLEQKPLAYWRMDDMAAGQAEDATGRNHAQYEGGVALFLPGPTGSGFTTKIDDQDDYGSRSVYLAGGHLAAELEQLGNQYSASIWFQNALPVDARETTGVLLSNNLESLEIAGTAAAEHIGTLTLRIGDRAYYGKTPIGAKHWRQVTLTRSPHHVRVFLDGGLEPEIDVQIKTRKSVGRWRVGSDGRSEKTFDGKVDEVAIFPHVLAPADVAALYAASGMTPPPRPKPTILLGPKPADARSRSEYAKVVLASKPAAYWRLHDATGPAGGDSVARDPVARDSVAKDPAGKSAGEYESGAGPLSASLSKPNFSGGRVKAKLPKLGDTYTVEMWVRNNLPTTARPVTAYLFSRGALGVEGAPGDNLGIGGTYSNAGQLIVFNGNERDQLVAGTTRLHPGGWSHLVMVRQKQMIRVYLNGDPNPELQGELPIGYAENTKDIVLGGRSDNFANLQGMLEEVAIYDRALTTLEIKRHFDAGGAKPIKKRTASESTPDSPSQSRQVQTPKPTESARATETIHVPAGFEVQLVAAEPLVKDPVAIEWGPDGRLWVVEMADYPLGVDGKGKAGGRVRYLEDTNDDGRYDHSTLFAEGLSFPTGILAWGPGVLVTAAPQILYLEDSNGDGKADVRRVLYSGFLEGNQQLRVNGLRWGLDNWVYCASGSHHAGYGKDSQITSHLTGKKHRIGSRDFRIRPDTGAIDPQSGPSQYGRNRDDWGNWFGVQNSHPLWHYVLADQNIRRNSHFAPPNPKRQIVTPTNPRVYPASQLQKRYHSFSQSGRFTSACSAMIYRDDYLFARNAEQHAFTCEPFHNLVQHNRIADDGVSFSFRRDPAESKIDFFASTDRWCRPVMARTGPDGALWVVDMYRYMIEHPQWLPKVGQDELRPWFRAGEDRGRIYRVVRRDRPAAVPPRLAKLSAEQLVAVLKSSNGWQRDAAQRMIVSSKQSAAIRPLQDLAKSEQPLARLHALCTLEGLDALSPALLEAAFADKHPGVRKNAVRIAAKVPVDIRRLAPLTDDPDAKVRLELASTLGAYDHKLAHDALARLLIRSGQDRFLAAAVFSSLNPKNATGTLRAVYEANTKRDQSLIAELIGQAVMMSDEDSLGDVIQFVCSPARATSDTEKFQSLSRVLNGLQRRGLTLESLPMSAVQLVAETIDRARFVVASPAESTASREASVALLGRDAKRRHEDFATMQRLLAPQSPVGVQQAVVTQLARRSEPEVADLLLEGWRSHSPKLRSQILDALATRATWAESLRRQLESGAIRPGELSASVRQRLLTYAKDSPKWRKALAAQASTDRAEVMRRFQAALKLPGDSKRGAAVFRKHCLNCHKVKEEGHEVGPQLASITNKTKEAMFSSILAPNAAVEAKYFSYTIHTVDGRSFTGRLETETGSSVTLLAAEGKRNTILRRDIEVLQASNKSLMPEGLEKELKPQDVADLIQYVRETFR